MKYSKRSIMLLIVFAIQFAISPMIWLKVSLADNGFQMRF